MREIERRSITDLARNVSEAVRRAEADGAVIITKHGRDAAGIVPLSPYGIARFIQLVAQRTDGDDSELASALRELSRVMMRELGLD